MTQQPNELQGRLSDLVERISRSNPETAFAVGAFPKGTAPTGRYEWTSDGCIREPGSMAPDTHTLWQLGSLTKTFTATALAAAVHQGFVGLEDPVQMHAPAATALPSYATDTAIIPMRFVDLATHTAALPLDPGDVFAGGYTVQAMYAYLQRYALALQPGARWNYSNLGFGLLANVIMSMRNFDEYQQLVDHLLKEGGLPMPDTVITPTQEQWSRIAWGHDADGRRPPWRTDTWPAFNGSGALYSTLADAMIWLAFNMRARSSRLDLLLPTLQKIYFDDGTNIMALAWQYWPLTGTGGSYFGKSGQTNGFSCFMAMQFDPSIGVMVFANNTAAPCQALAEDVLRLLSTE